METDNLNVPHIYVTLKKPLTEYQLSVWEPYQKKKGRLCVATIWGYEISASCEINWGELNQKQNRPTEGGDRYHGSSQKIAHLGRDRRVGGGKVRHSWLPNPTIFGIAHWVPILINKQDNKQIWYCYTLGRWSKTGCPARLTARPIFASSEDLRAVRSWPCSGITTLGELGSEGSWRM